jgi:hypothetical protein
VFYAVPHEKKVINFIISSAVDEFWEQIRYGEPLINLHPSEAFYTHEEIGSDLISNSRRVFKKLLFDVSGKLLETFIKRKNIILLLHKPKQKINKLHKGASAPISIDVLKPMVQVAVIDI